MLKYFCINPDLTSSQDHKSLHVWQTPLSGCLHITWNSTLTRQSNSSSREGLSCQWPLIYLENSVMCLIQTSRKLGVILHDQLSFAVNTTEKNMLLQINSPRQLKGYVHFSSRTISGPGFCNLVLQLSPEWSTCQCHLTFAAPP